MEPPVRPRIPRKRDSAGGAGPELSRAGAWEPGSGTEALLGAVSRAVPWMQREREGRKNRERFVKFRAVWVLPGAALGVKTCILPSASPQAPSEG